MTAPAPDSQGPLTFRYRFRFEHGDERTITVSVDRTTLALQLPPRAQLPAWTRLSHQQCSHCPLRESEVPQCPAAVSLLDIVELFREAVSFEEAEVEIVSEDRRYAKRTSLQRAVSSLVGLNMVTSGCPVMGKLKPMVRFHLPFATTDETKYRVLSMYLLAQYFRAARGQAADWRLAGLGALYEDIRTVNKHIARRLTEVVTGDASVNAVVILDAFANSISFSLDERMLDDLEALFEPHFDPGPPPAGGAPLRAEDARSPQD